MFFNINNPTYAAWFKFKSQKNKEPVDVTEQAEDEVSEIGDKIFTEKMSRLWLNRFEEYIQESNSKYSRDELYLTGVLSYLAYNRAVARKMVRFFDRSIECNRNPTCQYDSSRNLKITEQLVNERPESLIDALEISSNRAWIALAYFEVADSPRFLTQYDKIRYLKPLVLGDKTMATDIFMIGEDILHFFPDDWIYDHGIFSFTLKTRYFEFTSDENLKKSYKERLREMIEVFEPSDTLGKAEFHSWMTADLYQHIKEDDIAQDIWYMNTKSSEVVKNLMMENLEFSTNHINKAKKLLQRLSKRRSIKKVRKSFDKHLSKNAKKYRGYSVYETAVSVFSEIAEIIDKPNNFAS